MLRGIVFLFSCWVCLWGACLVQGQELPFPPITNQAAIGPAAISEDGLTVAVSYQDRGKILLFDLPSGLPKFYFDDLGEPVRYLTFDEINERLVAVTGTSVMLWSLPEGMEMDRIKLAIPLPEGAGDFLFDPARQLLFCTKDTDFYCYSLRQGGQLKKLERKKKKSRDSFSRPTLLAQAPDREVLWGLDPGEEELLQIDLTHFRVRERIKIQGAIALAVENRRIAVLASSPDRSSADQHTIHLFNRDLEKTGIFFVTLDPPENTAMKLHFTAPQHLSITDKKGIIDLDLGTGSSSPFDLQQPYNRIFFRRDGSLLLFHPYHMETIDPWGRRQGQYSLSPDPTLLYDSAKRQLFRLHDGLLTDAGGQVYCQLDTAAGQPVCVDLRDGVLATGTSKGAISLYDLESGQLLRTLPGTGRPFSRLLVMPEHRRVAAFTVSDRLAGLYDWENGSVVSWLRAEGSRISAIAYQGDSLFLGDESGHIAIFNPEDGRLQGSRKLVNYPVRAITANQKTLAVGSRSGITVVDLPGCSPRFNIPGHDNAVRWLQFSSRGDQLLSIAGDNTVRCWSLDQGSLIAVHQPPKEVPQQAFFLDYDSTILMSTVLGKVLKANKMVTNERSQSGPGNHLLSPDTAPGLAFNRSGTLVAVLDPGTGKIGIWETASGIRRQEIYASGNIHYSTVSFYGKDDILIAAGTGGFEYWDARTGKLMKRVDYGTVGLQPGVVLKSPGDDSLWTFQRDGDRILRMSASTGDIVYSRQVPAGDQLKGLAISPNGRWLAGLGKDRLYVLDNSGEMPPQLIMDIKPSQPVFGLDGRLLAYTKRTTGEVIIYDLYQEEIRFRVPGQGATFLDERRLIVYRITSSGFSALDIWDCLREGPVATIDIHPGASISNITAIAGGRTVVTTDFSGNLLFWTAPGNDRFTELDAENKEYLIQTFPKRPGSNTSLVEELVAALLPKPLEKPSAALSIGQAQGRISPHVVTRSTSLRSGAGADKGVIVRLPAGATVQMVEETDDPYWVRIRFGDHTGWAKKALLEKARQSKETL